LELWHSFDGELISNYCSVFGYQRFTHKRTRIIWSELLGETIREMDETNCPPGQFTDDILGMFEYSTVIFCIARQKSALTFVNCEMKVFDSVPYSCQGSVAAWIASMVVVIVLRCAVLLGVWVVWFRRRERLKAAIEKKRQHHTLQQSPNLRSASLKSSKPSLADTRWFPLIPVISTFDTLLQILFFVLVTTKVISITNGGSIIVIAFWVFSVALIQLFALRKLVHLGSTVFKFGGERITSTNSAITNFDRVLKLLLGVSLYVSKQHAKLVTNKVLVMV
jgi:hypothetical protein